MSPSSQRTGLRRCCLLGLLRGDPVQSLNVCLSSQWDREECVVNQPWSLIVVVLPEATVKFS